MDFQVVVLVFWITGAAAAKLGLVSECLSCSFHTDRLTFSGESSTLMLLTAGKAAPWPTTQSRKWKAQRVPSRIWTLWLLWVLSNAGYSMILWNSTGGISSLLPQLVVFLCHRKHRPLQPCAWFHSQVAHHHHYCRSSILLLVLPFSFVDHKWLAVLCYPKDLWKVWFKAGFSISSLRTRKAVEFKGMASDVWDCLVQRWPVELLLHQAAIRQCRSH